MQTAVNTRHLMYLHHGSLTVTLLGKLLEHIMNWACNAGQDRDEAGKDRLAFGALLGRNAAPGTTEARPTPMAESAGGTGAACHPGLHQPLIGPGSAPAGCSDPARSDALRSSANGILATPGEASLQPAPAL